MADLGEGLLGIGRVAPDEGAQKGDGGFDDLAGLGGSQRGEGVVEELDLAQKGAHLQKVLRRQHDQARAGFIEEIVQPVGIKGHEPPRGFDRLTAGLSLDKGSRLGSWRRVGQVLASAILGFKAAAQLVAEDDVLPALYAVALV